MLRTQRVRLVAHVAAVPLLVGACGPDPTAPREPSDATPPAAAAAAKVSEANGTIVAIDDALTRLLGSLDAATAASLKGPLSAIKAALQTSDGAGLGGAITVARQAVNGAAAPNDPDLAAISLVVDAAASRQ